MLLVIARTLQVAINENLTVKEGVPARWWNAVFPISLLIFLVLLALTLTGRDAVDADGLERNAENIFGNGNSYQALLWSTFFVSVVSWVMLRMQYHHDGKVMPFWKKHAEAKPIMGFKGMALVL
jgi:Na+/H+ antiporter NhaC